MPVSAYPFKAMLWKLLDSLILSVLLLLGTVLATESNPLQVVFSGQSTGSHFCAAVLFWRAMAADQTGQASATPDPWRAGGKLHG